MYTNQNKTDETLTTNGIYSDNFTQLRSEILNFFSKGTTTMAVCDGVFTVRREYIIFQGDLRAPLEHLRKAGHILGMYLENSLQAGASFDAC